MKRKTLLLVLTVISFTSTTIAQIPKGSTLLGGSIGFIKSKTSNVIVEKGTTVTIAPAWGTAIKENIFIGISPSYSYMHAESTTANTDQKISGYGISFFVRKYIPVVPRFYLFGDAAIGFSYSKQEQSSSTNRYDSKTTGVSLSLQPGVSFAVNNKIHLEAALNNLAGVNYSHTKSSSTIFPGVPVSSKVDAFGLGGNLSGSTEFRIGIRFLITPKV